jgi:hypothetical protein
MSVSLNGSEKLGRAKATGSKPAPSVPDVALKYAAR